MAAVHKHTTVIGGVIVTHTVLSCCHFARIALVVVLSCDLMMRCLILNGLWLVQLAVLLEQLLVLLLGLNVVNLLGSVCIKAILNLHCFVVFVVFNYI